MGLEGLEGRNLHPFWRRHLCRGYQTGDTESGGTRRCDLRQAEGTLCQQGAVDRARSHALSRAHDHVERARFAVERPPPQYGSPEGGHWAAGLWAARSAGRVQARILRHVRRDDEEVPGGNGPVPVLDAGVGAAAGGHGGRARSRRAAGTSARCGRARAASWRRKWQATAADCDLRRRARRSLPAQEAP